MSYLIFIGCKASGKNFFGEMLGKKCHLSVTDCDLLMEQKYAREHKKLLSTREIWIREGESYFRREEQMILAALYAEMNCSPIVSLPRAVSALLLTGGGVVERKENIDLLQKMGKCLFLYVSPETAWKRISKNPPPFLKDWETFLSLYQKREKLYRRCASDIVETEDHSPPAVLEYLEKIIEKIG